MHSKQWHYSLHRDFQNCYSTRRSPTGFFSSNSTRVPIHPHPHTTYTCTHPSREFSIQNPILHAEDKELFEYYYYIQRAKRPSFQNPEKKFYAKKARRSSRKCIRVSYKTFQGHSRHSSLSRNIPDIPIVHDLPAFPGNSTILQSSSISRESTPLQHSPIRMHILQFDWFPQKTPPSTS